MTRLIPAVENKAGRSLLSFFKGLTMQNLQHLIPPTIKKIRLTTWVTLACLSFGYLAQAVEVTYYGDGNPANDVSLVSCNGDKYLTASGNCTTTATNNQVTMKSGTAPDYVFGARTTSSATDVSGNKVFFEGGTVDGIRGGWSKLGNTNGNSITISGGKINKNTYGGRSEGGSASNNSITLSGSHAEIWGMSYGGYSKGSGGIASNNSVTISGGTTRNNIYGGWSRKGDAYKNSIAISGGTIKKNNHGGRSIRRNAYENNVTVSGGKIENDIYGGSSTEGDANNNSVTISGGEIIGNVEGGYSAKGNAYENNLTISGSNTTLGGENYGGYSAEGNAYKNNITINGGTISEVSFGGYSREGDAYENSVTISGATITGANVYGGYSTDKDATNNSVTISGGEITENIYGGYSRKGDATGNSVTISGSEITENIYGGYSYNGSKATNNTITISGTPVFDPNNTELYGGSATGEAKIGNTLNLHTTGIKVKNIANFENLHFYIQGDTAADDTFLTLTDNAGVTDITGTNIGVGVEGGRSLLNVGDKVVLIKKQGTGTLTDPNPGNNTSGMGMRGIAAIYEFEIRKEDSQTLIAETTKADVNPQTKSLLESGLAGVDFVNHGADLASGDGMQQLVQASANTGVNTFGAIGGGKYRTETGSHIDVKGANLLLGAGSSINNSAGQLHVGAYVEGGTGSYDSFNDFANAPSVRAHGNTKYYGLGLMLKQDFSNNLYVEGGLRFGKSKTSYNSSDLQGAIGNVSFKTKRSYTGATLGAGYQFKINDKMSLTPSARLLYTRLSGTSKVVQGTNFHFDSVRSLRTQLGAKLDYQLNDSARLYSSLTWEREHKGAAKGRVLGLNMPAPSMKGDTGIVELGAQFTPNKNLTIKVGAAGSFGKRRGGEANIGIKYDF